MDLSGQIGAQLALTGFAISIMIMMVFTTLGEMFHEPQVAVVTSQSAGKLYIHKSHKTVICSGEWYDSLLQRLCYCSLRSSILKNTFL